MPSCLLDSNILLRMTKNDDPHYGVVSGALQALVTQGTRQCFTSQTLGAFWNASTRPLDQNGFGLSIAETNQTARVIERDLMFLPDGRDVHERWTETMPSVFYVTARPNFEPSLRVFRVINWTLSPLSLGFFALRPGLAGVRTCPAVLRG